MRFFLSRLFLIPLVLIHLGIFTTFLFQTNFARPYLTIIGPVNMADGLGRQSVELINYLKDEFPIQFLPSRKKITFNGVPNRLMPLLKKRYMRQGRVVILEDQIWSKRCDRIKKLEKGEKDDQIRIAYSMFESTKIPSQWVPRLNTYFDAIAVPDEFLIQVYKDSGVTIPIFVLPLGLDLTPFRGLPLKSEKGRPFVFANFSACSPRKNHIQLVHAFSKAFRNNQDVKLRLNFRGRHKETYRALLDEIDALGLDNVEVTLRSLPLDEYLALYQKIDCYINLSRGEGFSIQPREAMVLGIPVIVTDNTGQSTICKSGLVTSVASTKRMVANYAGYGPTGENFGFEEKDAAKAMLHVYENFEKLIRKREAMRTWAMQYQYENLLPLYLSLVKPSAVILGEKNEVTPDYLMTDSEALYSKYLSLLKSDA